MTTSSAFPNPLAGLTELQAATQERQLQIMHALRTQGLLPTRDSLRAQGLPVSALALNRFRSWHRRRHHSPPRLRAHGSVGITGSATRPAAIPQT